VLRAEEKKHQRLGIRFSLLLKEKSLNLNLWNQVWRKFTKFIHGSAINTKSGLCNQISLLRANLDVIDLRPKSVLLLQVSGSILPSVSLSGLI